MDDENQYGAFGGTDSQEPPGRGQSSPPPVQAPQDVQSVLPPISSLEVAPPAAKRPVGRYEIEEGATRGSQVVICASRKTSMILYDFFVELVRKIYRDSVGKLYGTPDRRWGMTPQFDQIWIDTEFNWKPEHPEFLPGIFVKIPRIQYSSWMGNVNRPVDIDTENGVYQYQRVGTGTVSFHHVSRTSGEAVALCDNTRFQLSDFASQIAEDACFTKFMEHEVSPLSPAQKDSKETYQSVTTFMFEFAEKWGVKLESPILRSIDVLHDGSGYGILSLKKDGQVPSPDSRQFPPEVPAMDAACHYTQSKP